MILDKQEVVNYLKNLINQKVTRAKPGYGSFFTLDFGKDITVLTKKGSSWIRGEWSIWVYMAFWEFKKGNAVVLHSESKREEIAQFIKSLEENVLLNFEIISKKFDLVINFKNDIKLSITANSEEEDNKQWFLFTPHGSITAGPGMLASWEKSNV